MSLRNIFRQRLAEEKQLGFEEGIQQGIRQAIKSNIITILENRFQSIPSQLISLI